MNKKLLLTAISVCLVFLSSMAQASRSFTKTRAEKFIRSVPVKFLENAGQITDMANNPVPFVLFKASVPGLDLYVTEKGLSYIFNQTKMEEEEEVKTRDFHDPLISMGSKIYSWERVDVLLKGANIQKKNILKEGPEEGLCHYYLAHCPNGIRDVKQYAMLYITDVYPGIDWVLYNSNEKGFKYDFVVHPGADPNQIQLLYSSLSQPNLNEDGSFELKNKLGSIRENAPYTYVQETNQEIKSKFKIISSEKKEEYFETLIAFELGLISNKKTVAIDPQLVWATCFGSSGNTLINAIDHDQNDNIFITGISQGANFPVQSSGNAYYQGTFTITSINSSEVYISKFNASGVLIWSTYYGGSNGEMGYSIAVDSLNNVFVSGQTQSTDFPTQNSNTFFQGSNGGQTDAFLLKFDNAGQRLWASYYGGNNGESAVTIDVDNHGNIFAAGYTYSSDFPLQNAGTYYDGTLYMQGYNKGYILKFDNAGNRLWATLFACDIIYNLSVGKNGDICLTGSTYGSFAPFTSLNPGGGAYFQSSGGNNDAFIAKFDNAGNLLWSSPYGGNNVDYGMSVIGDKTGNFFLSGVTQSTNLPVLGPENSMQDSVPPNNYARAFVAKFGPNGSLLWATYCGSPGYNAMSNGQHLTIDNCNAVYLGFEATPGAPHFVACEGGYMDTIAVNGTDQYLMRFSNAGVLQWESYYGGSSSEQSCFPHINNKGDLYSVGSWGIDANTSSTYDFVNPGGGAYFSNTAPGPAYMGGIVKFNGRFETEVAEFSYGEVCVGSSSTLIPVRTASFVTGGFFSASPGVTVDQNTGQLIYDGLTMGSYTISYYHEACKCEQSQFVLYASTCEGLNENISATEALKIYGNPNSGDFKVGAKKETKLVLFNELGQTVGTYSISGQNNYQVGINGLSSGIYFLKEEKSTNSYKIVVIK